MWLPSYLMRARRLRAELSASPASGGFFFFYIVGAAGTVVTAASSAFGATCSGFVPTSGTLSGITTGKADGGAGDETGNAESGQDFFKLFYVHKSSFQVKRERLFPPGAGAKKRFRE